MNPTSGSFGFREGVVVTVILGLLTAGLFHDTLSGYWRFDDPMMLRFALKQSLLDVLWHPDPEQQQLAPFFTPLLTLSYQFDYHFFHLNPAGFYFHQLVVLWIAASLTYILLRHWVDRAWAWIGAMLFLVGFPTQVIAHQIMTRHYGEGLVWMIGALLIFIHAERSNPRFHGLAAIGYALAALSKEIFVPLGLLPLILETPSNSWDRRLWRTIPYLGVLVSYIPWRFHMLSGHLGGYARGNWPSLAQMADYLQDVPSWLFANQAMGILMCGLLMGVAILSFGRHRRELLVFGVLVLLLLGPLVPLMVPGGLPAHGTEFFIPERHWFLVWWCLSVGLVLGLARWSGRYSRFAMGLGLVVVLAAGIQPQKSACFAQLIAQNEQIYRLAGQQSEVLQVYVPTLLVPYVAEMTQRLAQLQGRPPEHLQVYSLNALPYKREAAAFVWHDGCAELTPALNVSQ